MSVHVLFFNIDALEDENHSCNTRETHGALSNAGDMSLIPGLGRSPRGGNSNPLQYSCLGNPVHRGAWWATVHGVREVRHN